MFQLTGLFRATLNLEPHENREIEAALASQNPDLAGQLLFEWLRKAQALSAADEDGWDAFKSTAREVTYAPDVATVVNFFVNGPIVYVAGRAGIGA